MIKASILCVAFAFGGSASAWAASSAPVFVGSAPASAHVVKVGEGCGANRWRDRLGNCHPFEGPGGTARGTRYECPPGAHIVAGGMRCFPNG